MFYNLKRCFGLLKVYWGTYDFDWSSLAVIMIYQMDRIAKRIKEDDIIEDAEEVVAEINKTKDALEYILDDKAHNEAMEKHGKQWVKYVDQYEKAKMQEFLDGIKNIRNWWD